MRNLHLITITVGNYAQVKRQHPIGHISHEILHQQPGQNGPFIITPPLLYYLKNALLDAYILTDGREHMNILDTKWPLLCKVVGHTVCLFTFMCSYYPLFLRIRLG